MTLTQFVLVCVVWCVSAVTSWQDPNDELRNKEFAGHRVLAVYGKQVNQQSPHINAIFEDKSGVYWGGTYAGLKRYDEKSDRWNDESHVTRRVNFIGQSADGKLWFGGRYLGNEDIANLVSFDGKEWRNIDSLPTAKNRGRSGSVTAIFQGRAGKLWIARRNELLAYENGGWSTPVEVSDAINSEFPVSIRTGLQDSEGDIWLATSEGIVRLNELRREGRIMDPFERRNNVSLDGKLSTYSAAQVTDGVYAIYEDPNGRVWFASAAFSGFHFCYDKRTQSWACFRLVDIPAIRSVHTELGLTTMYQDRYGRMMFGTKIGLITYTERDKNWQVFTTGNSALPDNRITTIFEDHSGKIWIATGAGILVLR
jgi:ligand-binding sensor domain-containing protein